MAKLEYEMLHGEGVDDFISLESAEDNYITPEEDQKKEEDNVDFKNLRKKATETAGIDFIELEDLDGSESVGSDDEPETPSEAASDSPNPKKNLYSSIANALVKDGVFSALKEDDSIESPEDLIALFEREVEAKLNEKQRRISEALSLDIPVDEVKRYEGVIEYLDGITDETLSEESEEGEMLRKNLIFQNYINRGFSKERATKAVDNSVKNGTDIEDAKEALADNKEFYKTSYTSLLEERKNIAKRQEEEIQKKSEEFKRNLLENDKYFGIEVGKDVRKKVYDLVTRPVATTQDGRKVTELQKYQLEHPEDFVKNVGLLFTLTNGFTDLNPVISKEVHKKNKKQISALEEALTGIYPDVGQLKYASGVS